VFETVDPRRLSVEVGEELAAVEVAPLPFVCMVVDREFDPTLRTGEPGPLRVAHPHVDPTPSAESSTRFTSHGDSRPSRWWWSSMSRMNRSCRHRIDQVRNYPKRSWKRFSFKPCGPVAASATVTAGAPIGVRGGTGPAAPFAPQNRCHRIVLTLRSMTRVALRGGGRQRSVADVGQGRRSCR
jgi:hypothetical protein